VVVTALAVKFGYFGGGRRGSGPFGGDAAAINEKSPLAVLNEGLRAGDTRALAFIQQRVTPLPHATRQALGDEESASWIETLSGLRSAFPNLKASGRATAVVVACRILDGFAIEPAPSRWVEALKPAHDLLVASLADSDPQPRCAALLEVSRLWVWIPGRSLTPFEEQTVGEWKAAIHMPVVRCLAARDPATRIAAINCLGSLPIDSAAAVAIAYLDDPNTDVRKQTLSSFSQRPILLNDDQLFKRLHDFDPTIREMAGLILKTRGLTQEQVSLGGLIYSPKPEQRVSVIPLLKNRTDVDPVVWLIQLSHDPVELVRMSAIDELAKHKTPNVQRRLAEMARSDASEAVRNAAAKVVPTLEEKTAALPPLPGSSSLNPKAN
jgi:hypothetical protein